MNPDKLAELDAAAVPAAFKERWGLTTYDLSQVLQISHSHADKFSSANSTVEIPQRHIDRLIEIDLLWQSWDCLDTLRDQYPLRLQEYYAMYRSRQSTHL